MLLVLYRKKHNASISQNLIESIIYSISWACGYVFTWLAKWILVDILFGRNIIKDSIQQVLFRVSGDVSNNGGQLLELFFYIIFSFYMALLFIFLYKVFSKKQITTSKQSLLNYVKSHLDLILISIIPVAWIIITKNHVLVHPWYGHKNLVSVIFLVIYLITSKSSFDNNQLATSQKLSFSTNKESKK